MSTVRQLLANLPDLDQAPVAVQVAFRRFDLAHARNTPEDRLIDWIGLEALYSDSTQELTYKFAIRIAHYIGRTEKDRVELFNSLKTSYNLRSRVVHGEGSPKAIRDAEKSSGNALRETLQRIVLGGQPPNLQDLDELAVRKS